jgi:hypothetical protein
VVAVRPYSTRTDRLCTCSSAIAWLSRGNHNCRRWVSGNSRSRRLAIPHDRVPRRKLQDEAQDPVWMSQHPQLQMQQQTQVVLQLTSH